MIRILATLLLLLLPSLPVSAAETASAASPRAVATLISDVDAVTPGRPFRVALRLRLAPGWHTYWRNPGDSGVAPTLTLSLPPGMVASGMAWPAPSIAREGPLVTYGYSGEVVLPVTVENAGRDSVDLSAHAEWLVCNNVCVPEQGDFSLHLPQGAPGPSAQAPLFRAAEARVPRPSPWTARIGRDGLLDVAGRELSPLTVKAAAFIPEDPDTIA
ncbi:MAG: cytochrome C biogenesis protein, partial [Acetobacteraceae bacterium]|nr:cytochrome C biogenesis protein [Acetobacteraceae bacterium]